MFNCLRAFTSTKLSHPIEGLGVSLLIVTATNDEAGRHLNHPEEEEQ
jgi:hypothetical protein